MSVARRPFQKQWSPICDQIELLKERGLTIADEQKATVFLKHVGYYRFSGYCLAFEDRRHAFRAGSTFDQITAAYDFDRKLRDLLGVALDAIEIDLRSSVANLLGEKCGPFCHADGAQFFDHGQFVHATWLRDMEEGISKSKEQFAQHFRDTYEDYPRVPVWVAVELMSFGKLSRMCDGLIDQWKTPLSHLYNQQKGDLMPALHHFNYVRNLCAHHSRVWDRVMSVPASTPSGVHWRQPHVPEPHRLYMTLLLMHRLLKSIKHLGPFTRQWKIDVAALMKTPPPTPDPFRRMGMPEKWHLHRAWT